jgi:hypothetical protein
MNSQEQLSLDKELNELKGFVADLKADRLAQKEKEQRESWTKYASLSLVFLAVLATVASTYSAKYGGKVLIELNNSTFHQAEAADEWSHYQAKSIKQNLYEALREVSPSSAGSNAAQVLESFKGKIAKYETEKTRISGQAKKLEDERDKSRAEAAQAGNLGAGMGAAVSIFQVALALGSICLVTKKKPLWYLTLGIGALAAAKMVMVWMS